MTVLPNHVDGKLTQHLNELSELYSVFTALRAMQTRSSDENSVHPSVCPSVRHTREL